VNAVDDRTARRDLYNGFGTTLARGIEIALSPFLVAGIGYAVDRLTGLLPVFTIVFAVLGLVGTAAHTYYSYDARMRVEEADGPWSRRVARP
jgi:F0F1-type ATP synthase assembly protein I